LVNYIGPYSGDGAKKNEMGWTRGTCDIEGRYVEDVGAEALRERDHLLDLNIDRMLILKHISKNWVCKAWTGLIWLRIGTVGRQAFWNTKERLCSTACGEFSD
jgi:hypothetical protein